MSDGNYIISQLSCQIIFPVNLHLSDQELANMFSLQSNMN